MHSGSGWSKWAVRVAHSGLILCLVAACVGAQTSPPKAPESPTPSRPDKSDKSSHGGSQITPEQAKQLFALVDELIGFSAQETGLPAKSPVKRQLTTRAEVEKYLDGKFDDDEGAKRLQRDEIVLKKFGLLDRDFDLRPFLTALLKEQIEAYYDAKTKTVNMLDWVDADEQKPVLAHELTHALQDQHADLEKWDDQTPDDVSTTSDADTDHLSKDEMDTARDAVAEGQATAVMMDYVLKPLGKSLVKDPEVLDMVKDQMNGSDSPVMSRAPLLLSESMLFPYREGLSFEQDIWMDQGKEAAFAGALDHPPTSSWEIINPREYEQRHTPVVPLLPNIHPLVDPLYTAYDIGQVGQLDLHILTELFGGDGAASDLTPAWNGGLYWAGQLKSAKTAAEQASTKSLALFYLSNWKSPAAARAFAKLYSENLARKYSGVKAVPAAFASEGTESGSLEQQFSTDEGPVLITTRANMVFVSESFDLPLARKLTSLILAAQGVGDVRTAQLARPFVTSERRTGERSLSSDLVRLFQNAGVMKAAVDAALRSSY